MKLSEYNTNDVNVFIDECDTPSYAPNSHLSIDETSTSTSSNTYSTIVKAFRNSDRIENTNWSLNGQQTYGLPPTGKRIYADNSMAHKNSPRIRVRSKPIRNYQLQPTNQALPQRPMSYNEKYDTILIDKCAHQTLNRNGTASNQQREGSPPSLSLSPMDSMLQTKTRTSPLLDNSDFINDMSAASSLSTITSISSTLPTQQKPSIYDSAYSSKACSFLNEYQQNGLNNHIDYRVLSPVLNTNIPTLSSPISSLPSSSSSSLSSASFTCPKGHEESSSSSSPIGSYLNQYKEFTLQTPTIDSSRDNYEPSTTKTEHSLMNISMSPNCYHQQTTSSKSTITSIPSLTNNHDRLKQQQLEQIKLKNLSNGCLKPKFTINNTAIDQKKKSVHFDRHCPEDLQCASPSTYNNYRPSVNITSSSISIGNSNSDNDMQMKKNYDEKAVEKEKFETTRRTIITSTPLSTNTIHRSFSLSPPPQLLPLLLKQENNDSRRHRQEKKENVDELDCTTTTTSRERVTTATHFHCSTTVNFNDGNESNLPTKEPPNDTTEHLMHTTADKHMPLNNLLTKTPTVNPLPPTKKSLIAGGLFNFMNRSNHNHNSSTNNDNNKLLKRTCSTQQKPKNYKIHGNKRFSADIDTLRSSSVSSKIDADKAITNYQDENQSTTDSNVHGQHSYNANSTILLRTNTKMNRSSMTMNPTMATVKSDERDSLNNGFLFQPVQTTESEPFYLSSPPAKALPNTEEPSSSMSKIMQTSTLIISTPSQYHYYLYPPTTTSKRSSTTNRSTSNVSMNSISTNSSSSNGSYESQSHDYEDDSPSVSTCSINHQKRVQQLRSFVNTKPVVLSDSVQAFWPPPSSLKNSPEQVTMASIVDHSKHSNSINHKHKQSESNLTQNNAISSTNNNNDSSAINNGNQTDVLSPSTSLILNNKQDVRSYKEQNSFANGSMRIISDNSVEDTQASYSERLREKSRSIKTTMNNNPPLSYRSRSRDPTDNQRENSSPAIQNTIILKPTSQARVQTLIASVHQDTSDDFQSKRQFFENRTYTDSTSTTSTNNKIYVLSPIHTTPNNNSPPQPTSSDSTIRTIKYFDKSSNQTPPSSSSAYRKPVRVVKAVQRSTQSPPMNEQKSPKVNSETSVKTCSSPSCSNEPTHSKERHRTSEYIRNLFPIPDDLKRQRSRQNSSTHQNNSDTRTVSNDHSRQTDDLLANLKKNLETLQENQRTINDEVADNKLLGQKLIDIIESKGEPNEIEKVKLHINEIDTITSILLKLSSRLAKVENDLLMVTEDNTQVKKNLLERRENVKQKHDEAKSLKDGIDKRNRLVANILRKYLSDEQYEDYDHFIRMKSTLIIDAKDTEEKILLIQKQIEGLPNTLSTVVGNQTYSSTSSISLVENSQKSNKIDNSQTNHFNPISTTA